MNGFFDACSLLSLTPIEYLELLELFIFQLLQRFGRIFVFLIYQELDVLYLVRFVFDFLLQKSMELFALFISLVILVDNLLMPLSQLLNYFVLGFSLLLDPCHVFDSELYLVAESVLQVSVVHVAQVVDLLLSVFNFHYLASLLIGELLQPLVSELFFLGLDTLETLRLGHLRNMVLELMDHLDVLNQWLSFFLFFDRQQGFDFTFFNRR